MTAYALALRVELARGSLDAVRAEFPEYRDRWAARMLMGYALQWRIDFRDAALRLRGGP